MEAKAKQNPKKRLRTADLMKFAGVGRNTLRFYEEKGLLVAAARTEAGYRVYSDEALSDLAFIKDAKGAGFTLEEIKELLELARRDSSTCGTVSQRITGKVLVVEETMRTLEKKKALLESFLANCERKNSANRCDIRGRGIGVSACCD